jgi:hypothetical protein
MSKITLPPYSKISYPSVPNKDFKWASGSDVQAIWRRFGWTPPSEKMEPPPPEKFIEPLRRFK